MFGFCWVEALGLPEGKVHLYVLGELVPDPLKDKVSLEHNKVSTNFTDATDSKEEALASIVFS